MEQRSIEILGVGCSKCTRLEERVRALAAEHNLNVSITKVSELDKIKNYGIMMTPGLVIDGKLVSYGVVPKDKQLLEWMGGLHA